MMDRFCSSKFWDDDITWNTSTPIFTPCFLKIALLCGPAAFFWVFSPIEIYFIFKSNRTRLPWTALNIASLIGAILYLVLSTVDMIYQVMLHTKSYVPPVDYYTPFVLLLTMNIVEKASQVSQGIILCD